jgi:hypothetical protein
MAIGGIPYYLRRIEKGMSATQIIESLAFKKKGFLLEEFEKLFDSLFDNGEVYIDIVRLIAKKHYGIKQSEIIKQIEGLSVGGEAGKKLKALEDTGFIMKFKPIGFKRRGNHYKVIDEYTLFYFRWIEPIKESLLMKSIKPGYWESQTQTPAWHSWAGLAFEATCYKHLAQISNALNLPPTAIPDCWRYTPEKSQDDLGAQIDLLFDRCDDSTTLCEIKYTNKPYTVDKIYAAAIQRKIDVYKKQTGTQKQIFMAMISANGLQKTMYSEELIDNIVVLADLFVDP